MWTYDFERYNDAIFIILEILIKLSLKTRLIENNDYVMAIIK